MWANVIRMLLPILAGWVGSDLADLYKSKGNQLPSGSDLKETFGGNLAKYGIISAAVLVIGFLGYNLIKSKR